MTRAEAWDRFKNIAAIVMAVCLVLYFIRCLAGGGVVNLGRFGAFLQGLLGYLTR